MRNVPFVRREALMKKQTVRPGDNRFMAMQTMLDWAACPVLESVEGKLGGAWVFRGTRVPVTAVLSNLSEMSLREIEEDFPTVRHEQITGLLDFIARSAEQPELSL